MRHNRTFVIGDVHGCDYELRSLYSVLDPRCDDKFVFVGDIVDKGPNSIKALRFVRLLMDLYPGSVCVAGNHESKALERLRQGKGAKAEPWHLEATEADWAFIKSMPLYHRLPELNALVVHAGVFPRFFELYPEGLDDKRCLKDGWQKGGGKYLGRARRFQYVRFIDPATGDMLQLGKETEDTPSWSDLYDGREGQIFYGHEPQRSFQPKIRGTSIGLDTSCVSGGKLTAAVLRDGLDEYGELADDSIEFVQVQSNRIYQEWKPEMYFHKKEEE